jgi:staphylococcal nuclease domain-containing protein 1
MLWIAIIEQVRDASTFRVLLMLTPQEHQMITLQLSGVKAPVVRKDIPDQPDVVEPFGEEAKYFVESRLLQRGVKVILEGAAQSGNPTFVGSVLHPAGNIAEALLSQGLAKCVDWSITLVTGGPVKLRNAER